MVAVADADIISVPVLASAATSRRVKSVVMGSTLVAGVVRSVSSINRSGSGEPRQTDVHEFLLVSCKEPTCEHSVTPFDQCDKRLIPRFRSDRALHSREALAASALRVCMSPLSDRLDHLVDGVLQLIQTPAYNGFGLAVALVFVVELLVCLFGGRGRARLSPERTVRHPLTLKHGWVWQRNLSYPGPGRWRVGGAHLGTIRGEAGCTTAHRDGAKGQSGHRPRKAPSARLRPE